MITKLKTNWRSFRLLLNSLVFLLSFFIELEVISANNRLYIHRLVSGTESLSQASQSESVPQSLSLNSRVKREISAGKIHYYQITLSSGQFLRIETNRSGVGAAIIIYDPDGKAFFDIKSLSGSQVEDTISVIATGSGIYRLEVRTLENGISNGRYELSIKELRQSKPEDKNRIAAEHTFREARHLYGQGTRASLEKSVENYAKALAIYRELKDPKWEAASLASLGVAYVQLREPQKALEYLNQALPRLRQVGDRLGEAGTLNNISSIYLQTGKAQHAPDLQIQALAIMRELGDHDGEARTLMNIGVTFSYLGNLRKSLDYYDQALSISRNLNLRANEASLLNNIGLVYQKMGETKKALECFNEALPVVRGFNSRPAEAQTLNNIGMIYDDWGDIKNSLKHYEQALTIFEGLGDKQGINYVNQNIGNIYLKMDEPQEAISHYNRGLELSLQTEDRRAEANALSNLGIVFSTLRNLERALEFFNQALLIWRATGDQINEGQALNNIGMAFALLGERQKALTYFSQSYELNKRTGNRQSEATALDFIGNTYAELGDVNKALTYFERTLDIHKAIGDPRAMGQTLSNIGVMYYRLGEYQKALDTLNQSLSFLKSAGDRTGEALALFNTARVHRALGNLKEALSLVKVGMEVIELFRTKIFSPELRTSYFASVREQHDLYINILMNLHKKYPSEGYDSAALHASEAVRARSLLELLNEARADLYQGIDPKLLEQKRSLHQLLNVKAQHHIQLIGRQSTLEQAKVALKEIESLINQLNDVDAQIRADSPRYAELTKPEPLSLREIQRQILDPDTMLLEYYLGEERSYLWAVTSDSIKSFELPKRKEIEEVSKRVYDLLTTRSKTIKGESLSARNKRIAKSDDEYPEAAATLSQLLLEPVTQLLGAKRLMVVADGALQYIPLAALPAPKKNPSDSKYTNENWEPLVSKHEIIYLPSASTLAALRSYKTDRAKAPHTVAVLADPVFEKNDPRVKPGSKQPNRQRSDSIKIDEGSVALRTAAKDTGISGEEFTLPRLPNSRKEAASIISLVPKSSSKQALDFDANYTTATSPELSQYKYIHFATHGLVDSSHPDLSGIVLSLVDPQGRLQEKGFLRLHEIYNLKLPAEMVVLSACSTALGKEVKGEGLVGLTRGFMYAGSPRVVASLWKVEDKATSELMKRFYEGMLGQRNLKGAAALREAQLLMFSDKKWRAPFYWAAFVLQGEWK